jgi:hypothetical protein
MPEESLSVITVFFCWLEHLVFTLNTHGSRIIFTLEPLLRTVKREYQLRLTKGSHFTQRNDIPLSYDTLFSDLPLVNHSQ